MHMCIIWSQNINVSSFNSCIAQYCIPPEWRLLEFIYESSALEFRGYCLPAFLQLIVPRPKNHNNKCLCINHTCIHTTVERNASQQQIYWANHQNNEWCKTKQNNCSKINGHINRKKHRKRIEKRNLASR